MFAGVDHPYLAWEVVPEEVSRVWGADGSLAWIAPSAYNGKPWLTTLGDPAVIVDLVAQADLHAVVGITVPPESLPLLSIQPRRVERWTWWWTQHDPGINDPRVRPLTGTEPGLAQLLQQSSSVYLRPGDPRVLAWFGLWEQGELAACLAVESHKPGIPHLASVVVDAQLRGQGLGRALCGTVVHRLLAAAPAVTLGMMTANAAAAGLYRGLGFTAGPSYASGPL